MEGVSWWKQCARGFKALDGVAKVDGITQTRVLNGPAARSNTFQAGELAAVHAVPAERITVVWNVEV